MNLTQLQHSKSILNMFNASLNWIVLLTNHARVRNYYSYRIYITDTCGLLKTNIEN